MWSTMRPLMLCSIHTNLHMFIVYFRLTNILYDAGYYGRVLKHPEVTDLYERGANVVHYVAYCRVHYIPNYIICILHIL